MIQQLLSKLAKSWLLQRSPALLHLQQEYDQQQSRVEEEGLKLAKTVDREYRIRERLRAAGKGMIGWLQSVKKSLFNY